VESKVINRNSILRLSELNRFDCRKSYQTQDRFPAYGDSSVTAAVVGIAGFGTSNRYLDSVTLDDDGTVSAIFADDGALGK
jgi:hypothetical protein